MTAHNPIDLLFGGMGKLGPGSNLHTLHVLRLLPERKGGVIVDAGCGTGRQPIALAKELRTLIRAADAHDPFVADLRRRAQMEGAGHLVQAHGMDMQAPPAAFQRVDPLWSEGAADRIGVPKALTTWAPAVDPGGVAVAGESSWPREQAPDAVRACRPSGHPGMRSVRRTTLTAGRAGYRVLTTYTLPEDAWVEGEYDVLGPRARSLGDHPESSVRDFAAETINEIATLRRSDDGDGYAFYVLQRASPGAAADGPHGGPPLSSFDRGHRQVISGCLRSTRFGNSIPPDGVCTSEGEQPTWRREPRPTPAALSRRLHTVSQRVARLLERKG